MRIKAKVEIVLNTDGTWEVVRFLSGPTKQVKLMDMSYSERKDYMNPTTHEEEERKWRDEDMAFRYDGKTPVQDALDNARRVRRQARRHDWSNTTRQIQTCSGCGHPGVNIRTCRGDGTHRPARAYWGA